MRIMSRAAVVLAVALAGCGGAQAQTAAGELRIVSAFYGPAGSPRPYEFTARLQQTCGDRSEACETFCSKAQIGKLRSDGLRLPFSGRPVCRVVYRCGEELTRATETDDNETLVMSCRPPR